MSAQTLRTDLDAAVALVPRVQTELARRHLADFVKQAWHVLEPQTVMKWNWHMDAICLHVEAVFSLKLGDIVFTIPPRCMKSLLISVFAPVWRWIDHPGTRFLTASYDGGLATRDAVKSRRLIQSPWFQSRWGHIIQMSGDQNVKSRYENTKGGYRIATSVGGIATGEGGDFLMIDDAHNAKKSDSETDLREKRLWYKEVWYNRVNDPVLGRRITIGQRVNEGDVPGVILQNPEVESLCLPMEFEPDRACKTSLGWEDPRKEFGDLLWPEHFPEEAVARYRRELGEYAYAGQYRQAPAPREGGMFKMDRVAIVREIPPNIVKKVRGWDKAATVGGNCNSAGVQIGRYSNGRFIFLHVSKGKWSSADREDKMLQQAVLDGVETRIVHEQEPGSGGKDSALATSRNLAAFNVIARTATGDKISRADPMSRAIERGDFDMLEGEWNQEFIDEMKVWPAGKMLDQGDASATAYNELASGGMDWVDLYPANPEADKVDDLGLIYGDDIEEGGDNWAQL